MKIQEGYLYHIKDEYFDLINDETLMQNHERGINLFFTDIDKIKKFLLKELKKDNQ